MHQIEIIDDWEVLGLRGTGSRSLLVNDVFRARPSRRFVAGSV